MHALDSLRAAPYLLISAFDFFTINNLQGFTDFLTFLFFPSTSDIRKALAMQCSGKRPAWRGDEGEAKRVILNAEET